MRNIIDDCRLYSHKVGNLFEIVQGKFCWISTGPKSCQYNWDFVKVTDIIPYEPSNGRLVDINITGVNIIDVALDFLTKHLLLKQVRRKIRPENIFFRNGLNR